MMIKRIPLDALRASPTNPRTEVDPVYISELAATILLHGVMQPITVCRGEIVFGHCRWMGNTEALRLASIDQAPAEKLEELGSIPCLVRDDLTAQQIVEMQIIENLQRKDVSPKDEAFGYARLLEMKDDTGVALYTQEKIGAAIGKTKQYVSCRLMLRFVPAELWAALAEKKVYLSQLELVGGLAHEKMRAEGAKRVLKAAYSDKPMSKAETEEMVKEYRRSLRGCGFDQKDADLVPVQMKDGQRVCGGACADCPFVSKNMPELQERLAQGLGEGHGSGKTAGVPKDICYNTVCLDLKQNAVFRKAKAVAENEGRRVWDVDQTSEMKLFKDERFSNGEELNWDSDFVKLTEPPDHEATGHHADEELAAWEDLLKGTVYLKESIMARSSSKKVYLILERDRAVELAIENGHEKLFAQRPEETRSRGHRGEDTETGEDAETRRVAAEEQRKQTLHREIFKRLFIDAVGDKLRVGGVNGNVGKLLMRPAVASFSDMDGDCRALVMRYLGASVDEDGPCLTEADLWGAMEPRLKSTPDSWFELMAVMLLALELTARWDSEVKDCETSVAVGKVLKIDLGKIKDQTKTAVAEAERRQWEQELAELPAKRLKIKPGKKGDLAAVDARAGELRLLLNLPEPVGEDTETRRRGDAESGTVELPQENSESTKSRGVVLSKDEARASIVGSRGAPDKIAAGAENEGSLSKRPAKKKSKGKKVVVTKTKAAKKKKGGKK